MEINEALEWMDRLVTFCGRDVHGRAMKTIRAALAESTNSSHNKASAPCKWRCSCGQEVVGDYCKCGAYRCDL